MFQRLLLGILGCWIQLCSCDSFTELGTNYYLIDWKEAGDTSTTFSCQTLKLCPGAIPSGYDQISFEIIIQGNGDWNDRGNRILSQISICQNTFTKNCTIATNYYYPSSSSIETKSSLIINLNRFSNNIGEATLYIRTFGFPNQALYSIQASFTGNQTESYYNYTTDNPFGGTTSNGCQFKFAQNWRTTASVISSQYQYNWFGFSYCAQPDQTVQSITISAVSTFANSTTLMNIGACPKTIESYYNCTPVQAKTLHWWNTYVAEFSTLRLNEAVNTLTAGVWGLVYTTAPGPQEFYFRASIDSPQ